MSEENPILVGVFDGFSWIRCVGKGSFLNSPGMKAFGEARIAAGERLVVIDLGGCTGMDSTFMGTMAGIASRMTRRANGSTLQVADPGMRNRRSLEDLGLDCMIEIEPDDAVWQGRLTEVRADLRMVGDPTLAALPPSEHVLEAHRHLSSANPENADKFSNVVQLLEKEVLRKGASKR